MPAQTGSERLGTIRFAPADAMPAAGLGIGTVMSGLPPSLTRWMPEPGGRVCGKHHTGAGHASAFRG